MIAIGQAFALAGVGLTLALAWAGWNHPLGIASPLMLLGIGHGLLMPAALAAPSAWYPRSPGPRPASPV
jgi:DHA1 family bicyclomycin/chloramphenicol resistance-like MFS transporter